MKKINTLIKLSNHFVEQDNIRGIARVGTGTRVSLKVGEDIYVEIPFDKIKRILTLPN